MRRSLYHVIPVTLLLLTAACSQDKERSAPSATRQGLSLFKERCRDCHAFHRAGGSLGPDLTAVAQKRSRRFIEQVIREPSQVFPGTVMPLYRDLSARQVSSLIDYLSGRH